MRSENGKDNGEGGSEMSDLLMSGAARYLDDRHRALQFGDGGPTADGWASRPYQHPPKTKGLKNMRFYQTKPFVMFKKWHRYFSERVACVDYRKMTNDFVFLEMRVPGKALTLLRGGSLN